MSSQITAVEYFLPEGTITNGDLAQQFEDWDAAKIEAKTGMRQRHYAAEGQTSLDLGYAAAEKLFQTVDKSKIDFLLFCTQTPDYFLPTSACILQEKLGLGSHIGALDMNLGCSGYIYGLMLAKGLIAGNRLRSVLLITAETYSKLIHPQDRSNKTIFGDAGAATIIEASEKEKIHQFSMGTNGQGSKKLILGNGGFRHPVIDKSLETDPTASIQSGNYLYMDGPDIFNFTIATVPKLIQDVLEKNALTMDQIDYVIFHQANKYMIEHLRKKIKIPPEKFCICLADVGNTVSCTIPIALKESLNNGSIKPGSKVLLAGFGVGLSWGATIVEI